MNYLKIRIFFITVFILLFSSLCLFLFFNGKIFNFVHHAFFRSQSSNFSIVEGSVNNTFTEIVKKDQINLSRRLVNPPTLIKAVYLTSWSAGSARKIDYILKLIKDTELNAVVIDLKDSFGYVAYDSKIPVVEEYKTKNIKIPRFEALIKNFHDNGIYVIGRLAVFQDTALAKARPDWAVQSLRKLGMNYGQITQNTLWLDKNKLAWIDPLAKGAWDYNIAIAQEVSRLGIDEVNFDYIRFPSDGRLEDMQFIFWDRSGLTKRDVMLQFFQYLRNSLPGIKLSADFFGLVTVKKDDLGIGQVLEDAFEYFDYISPMVYPSHYASGFLGYKNPAEYPYEVVRYSLTLAFQRMQAFYFNKNNISSSISSSAKNEKNSGNLNALEQDSHLVKLRPWLQDFSLATQYNQKELQAQIQAVFDSASSTSQFLNGFMLWSPENIYTEEALRKK